MTKRVVVELGIDEIGEPEMFTWDLYLLVEPERTLHLDSNGLPKKGTRIEPGMILIGKSGQSKTYKRGEPNSLEMHALAFDELRAKYGHMWTNTSLYATDGTSGIVADAYIEEFNGKPCAVVILE